MYPRGETVQDGATGRDFGGSGYCRKQGAEFAEGDFRKQSTFLNAVYRGNPPTTTTVFGTRGYCMIGEEFDHVHTGFAEIARNCRPGQHGTCTADRLCLQDTPGSG